jgi:hypothetical protein
MAKGIRKQRLSITRRKFLQYSAGAGALLGAGSLVGLPGNAKGANANTHPKKRPMQSRTYIFNLSHLDCGRHDLFLVAGNRRVRLNETTPGVLQWVREDHPIFRRVPTRHMTHYVTLRMPEDAIQLCYVKKVARGRKGGQWTMAQAFYHLPKHALIRARKLHLHNTGSQFPKVHVKWKRYGLTPRMIASFNDPVGEAMLLDTTDTATACVASHHELACGDPDNAAYIHKNIIGTQGPTENLADVIEDQGDDWATNTPVTASDTGKSSQVTIWSEETAKAANQAIGASLDTAKNDTQLGANVTTVDPTTVPDDDAHLNGTIWAVHDGQSTVDQSVAGGAPQGDELPFQFTDQSPGHGYSLEIKEVGTDGGTRTITFTAKNWFVRYLSLYVRYLDGSGQPISLSQIESTIQSGFPLSDLGFNGANDAFLDMVSPEFVFMGIPCRVAEVEKTIPVPQQAASVLILAGGLGTGDNPYPDTLPPGLAFTAVFNLAVPSLMLALAAAAGFSRLIGELENAATLHEMLEEVVPWLTASVQFDMFENPEVFIDLAVEIGEQLLTTGGEKVDALIAEAIAEGEAIEAVEDAIPVIGFFFSALWAIGLIGSITETSAQVGSSPRTYIDEIAFTHDIDVTIKHDPNHPAGFPSTATFFTVTALFDGGTPRTITQNMPGTTVSQPITVTFKDVPAGGQVKMDVGFYGPSQSRPDGFLVGQGSVGPVQNNPTLDPQNLEITITEIPVTLWSGTFYTHKEVIQLDEAGNHVWQATPVAPAVQPGLCNDTNAICAWTDITVSTATASVGYAWRSYNDAVVNCVSGGATQLHQFANISVTENPQSGYLFSGCGFSGVTRIVYDLMGKQDWNFYIDPTQGNNSFFIRQIRLTAGGASFYDSPISNKAFGRLRFASDALLLHPLGKIVSISSANNKLEVVDLPGAAVPDAIAPRSQVRGGFGTREGLMDGPIHAAITPQGAILVLEQNNNRIQAFDLGGNPIPYFANDAYFIELRDIATYLDLAVEYSGYLYVLSRSGNTYRLDLYTPEGAWLARTEGVNADKLAVDYWRDVFTLNYQPLKLPNGNFPTRTEPSVSHWTPSLP